MSVTEYDVLLKALETGQSQQYSVAKGEIIDSLRRHGSGWRRVIWMPWILTSNDHLIPSLATGKGDVILAGGAAYLNAPGSTALFLKIEDFFPRLSLAWEHQDALTRLVEAQPAGVLRNAVDGDADDGLLWPVPSAAR